MLETPHNFILMAEHRQTMFKKSVLRRIFEPNRSEVTGTWRKCIIRSFINCTALKIF
jgi:hypothetical protein